MARKKTAKAPEGFIDAPDVRKDKVSLQVSQMKLKAPEKLPFKDFVDESDEVMLAILKAINGKHVDIVANAMDCAAEMFVRRFKDE